MELLAQYSDGCSGMAKFSCFGRDYKYSFVDHKFYKKDNHESAIWQEITENDYRRAEYFALTGYAKYKYRKKQENLEREIM